MCVRLSEMKDEKCYNSSFRYKEVGNVRREVGSGRYEGYFYKGLSFQIVHITRKLYLIF